MASCGRLAILSVNFSMVRLVEVSRSRVVDCNEFKYYDFVPVGWAPLHPNSEATNYHNFFLHITKIEGQREGQTKAPCA